MNPDVQYSSKLLINSDLTVVDYFVQMTDKNWPQSIHADFWSVLTESFSKKSHKVIEAVSSLTTAPN